MSEYDRVVAVLQDHELNWTDVDRIHLNGPAYDDFKERYDGKTSHYSTTDKPAVRPVPGDEKIVYVDESGRLREISLEDKS